MEHRWGWGAVGRTGQGGRGASAGSDRARRWRGGLVKGGPRGAPAAWGKVGAASAAAPGARCGWGAAQGGAARWQLGARGKGRAAMGGDGGVGRRRRQSAADGVWRPRARGASRVPPVEGPRKGRLPRGEKRGRGAFGGGRWGWEKESAGAPRVPGGGGRGKAGARRKRQTPRTAFQRGKGWAGPRREGKSGGVVGPRGWEAKAETGVPFKSGGSAGMGRAAGGKRPAGEAAGLASFPGGAPLKGKGG